MSVVPMCVHACLCLYVFVCLCVFTAKLRHLQLAILRSTVHRGESVLTGKDVEKLRRQACICAGP